MTGPRFRLEVYLNYKFPNLTASGIQAVRVAESLARAGTQTIFFYRGGRMPLAAWADFYGVGPAFAPRPYPGLSIRGRRLPLVSDFITRTSFAARVARPGRFGTRVFYGWNPRGFPMSFFLVAPIGSPSAPPAPDACVWPSSTLPSSEAASVLWSISIPVGSSSSLKWVS